MASNANERDTARPRFYRDAVQNMAKSQAEGRPMFDEKEMVEVKIPGDKQFSWVGEVEEKHRTRWPDQYAAFKRGEARAASGTPLEQWPNPLMTAGKVAELKASNILSVEELAGIPDSTLTKMGMGARDLRDQARSYIETAKDSAANNAMAAENADLRRRLEALEAMMSGKQPSEQPKEKTLEDCTDDELRAFIERETGAKPHHRTGRDKLLEQAAELAQKAAA